MCLREELTPKDKVGYNFRANPDTTRIVCLGVLKGSYPGQEVMGEWDDVGRVVQFSFQRIKCLLGAGACFDDRPEAAVPCFKFVIW